MNENNPKQKHIIDFTGRKLTTKYEIVKIQKLGAITGYRCQYLTLVKIQRNIAVNAVH